MTPAAKLFLFDLLSTPSPTGFEARGQRKWVAYLRQHADAVESDAYGNAWATLEGRGKQPRRVMLEAHADEIGYIVRFISRDGFIYVDRIGGSDVAAARGRRVDILGDSGTVRGVIGNTAIHIRGRDDDEKVPKQHEIAIDIGASSSEEVAQAGIRAGHAVVYADTVEEMGYGRLCGRALDNRIGGFIISEVLRRLHGGKKRPVASVIALNAVQEEIGGHGAKMAVHRLMPDVAICLDVTHATDTPGIDQRQHGTVRLGGGPSLTHGAANHAEVVQRLMSVAEKEGIPIQHEAVSRTTGTDTNVIFHQQHGVPSVLVSLPLRYMHSVVEMASYEDIENVILLLVGFVESVKEQDVFAVKV